MILIKNNVSNTLKNLSIVKLEPHTMHTPAIKPMVVHYILE